MMKIGFKTKANKDKLVVREIQHQDYYKLDNGIECIDVAGKFNFFIGNAIKYLWRCGRKIESDISAVDKAIEDLNKAKIYIDYEINRLQNEGSVRG